MPEPTEPRRLRFRMRFRRRRGAPKPEETAPALPAEAERLARLGDRPAMRYGPRILNPAGGRRRVSGGARFALRAGIGSLGLAFFVGVFTGRRLSGVDDTLFSVEFRGPGRVDADASALRAGFFADPEGIRRRLGDLLGPAAAAAVGRVEVLRTPEGGVEVVVEEKRAAAILLAGELADGATGGTADGTTDGTADRMGPQGPGGGPPLAIAGDGALLGPATAADLDWAGAADLPIVRGADPASPDFAERARTAGRLAAALAAEPALDRRVSELGVAAAPALVSVLLRDPPGITVLAAAEPDAAGSGSPGFTASLRAAAAVAPDLLDRWPDLTRIDARIPDRLLLRRGGPPPPPTPAPEGDPDR